MLCGLMFKVVQRFVPYILIIYYFIYYIHIVICTYNIKTLKYKENHVHLEHLEQMSKKPSVFNALKAFKVTYFTLNITLNTLNVPTTTV